jgi:hypothetical protein
MRCGDFALSGAVFPESAALHVLYCGKKKRPGNLSSTGLSWFRSNGETFRDYFVAVLRANKIAKNRVTNAALTLAWCVIV